MSQAAFAHSEWLDVLVWTVTASALGLLWARRLAKARCRRLLGAGVPASTGALVKDLALLAALAAIAIALLGPHMGERTVLVPSTGVDVVFLVDVSRSMDATDIPPSRLVRARHTVAELLGRLEPGDRAALAAFAGRGLLLTPLTPDRGALMDLVGGLESSFIQPASSNLGNGVRAALAAFETASERPRALFVVSDGEDPRRRSDLGTTEAVRLSVRVVTAGLGSEAGSFIPDGGRTLRDRSGARVSSRRNTERLARLATATGGGSFVGDEWGRIDLAGAIGEIRRDVGPGGERVKHRVAAVRVVPFAALAFVLLLFEGLPRFGRRNGGVATLAYAAAAILALLVAAGPPRAARGTDPGRAALNTAEARVRLEPENARAHIALGMAYLEQGRRESAARAFLSATVYARDPEVAAVAHYDLGVTALEGGELETAREAFFDALGLNPSDSDARFNLEWTLAALRSQPPEPVVQSGESGPAKPPDPASPPRGHEEPSPTASPAADPTRSDPADSLSPDQRRRWLERATDDARRWLRSNAGPTEESPRSSGEPVW